MGRQGLNSRSPEYDDQVAGHLLHDWDGAHRQGYDLQLTHREARPPGRSGEWRVLHQGIATVEGFATSDQDTRPPGQRGASCEWGYETVDGIPDPRQRRGSADVGEMEMGRQVLLL